jgi:hypothetical protein
MLPIKILPLLFIAALPLNAMGGSASGSDEVEAEYMKDNGKQITVSGTVRIVGSMPFTETVISDNDADWFIDKDERSKLAGYQGETVKVSGKARYTSLILANGEQSGVRRDLTNIKILR